jgi:hypothetical protein
MFKSDVPLKSEIYEESLKEKQDGHGIWLHFCYGDAYRTSICCRSGMD